MSVPKRRAMSSTRSRQPFALAVQVVVGPGQLGDVVAVDEHERAGRPQQVLGRPLRVAGDPAGQRQGDPARRADLDEAGEPVGQSPGGPGEVAQLDDLGARHLDAAALGPVGEQRVALDLRRLGAVDRRVARRLDGGQAAARRLGTVVGVAGVAPGRGDLGAQAPRRRRACRVRAERSVVSAARQLVDPRPAARRARRGCGRPPARPPPAGARPAQRGLRRRRAPRRPRASATSAVTRSSQPSSRRSHSIPIGSTSSGSAPADSRRRNSASASIARRSVPSARARDPRLAQERLQRRRVRRSAA